MFSSWENDLLGALSDALAAGNPMNWDMATHPNFKENLGQGRDAAAHAFFISNRSKHKEEAFQVMKMVTEPEVQSLFNRNGVLTVLSKTEEVKKEYGNDIPVLQGKNTAAIFKMKPSPVVSHTYYSIISSQLTKAASSVALKQKDVNTALRDAEEEATKLIAVELKK
jgi:multiple sugar transport system substrate-binding protein